MKLRARNLLRYPRVRVIDRRDGVTRVLIDGLVCDEVCAERSAAALSSLPGVRSATVDFNSGIGEIRGASPDAIACQRAIDAVVAGKMLRRALDAARRRFEGRRGGAMART